MKKLFAAAVALGLMISPCLPAQADGKAHSSAKNAASSEELNFGDVVNGISFTGARLVKFTLGLSVGAPVGVLRKALRQTHDSSKNVAGDHNEACYLLTEALMLPTVGVFVGGLDGLGWSVGNSWKYSEEKKPFDIKKEIVTPRL